MRPSHRLIDPNSISVDEIEDITNQVTRYEIEDVTPPPEEKAVNDDAIHLFPLDMYQTANLNITGNREMDKLASPCNLSQSTPSANASANTQSATSITEGQINNSEPPTSNPLSDVDKPPSLSVKPAEHTHSCPTDLPGANNTQHEQSKPPQAPDQAPDQDLTTEGGPQSSQGVHKRHLHNL